MPLNSAEFLHTKAKAISLFSERAAIMQDMVWTRIENSSNVIVKDSGHLVSLKKREVNNKILLS